jgi:putative oxidoreductase
MNTSSKIIALALRTLERTRGLAAPTLALVTRLVIGYAFYQAGTGKFAHFESTVKYFTSLGLPVPALNAGFIASLETAGGIALMLGAGTRLFSLLLSSTMVVALATAHAGDLASALTVGGKGSLTDITAFVYLLFLLLLALWGAGALSVDGLVGGKVLRAIEGIGGDATPRSGPSLQHVGTA